MVFPALASVTGHALCGVSASTTCEECKNCFNNITESQHQATQSQSSSPSNGMDTKPQENEDSNRTLKTENKPQQQTTLLTQRQQSVTLFARPIITQDLTTEAETKAEIEDRRAQKTTIVHQKDGEDSVFEVSLGCLVRFHEQMDLIMCN